MAGVQPLRPIFWARLRFQVPVGILIAAVLPAIGRVLIYGAGGNSTVLQNTLVGTALAILIGAWLTRNVATYPGSEALASALSSFSLVFSALLIAFVFGRIPYNRTTLLLGYFLTLVWFFLIGALAQHRQRLHIGVLPFGDVAELPNFSHVTWSILHSPESRISGLDAIAADLRIDLPNEWDRKLADYALGNMPVYHVKHLLESLTGKVELEHLSENSFGSLTPRLDYMMFKNVVDWLMAFFMGVLLLPLIIVISILVRLTSPVTALFLQ